jgi:hypothetical protein
VGRQERVDLYGKIEAHRGHPLVAYVTSKRDGFDASMAGDALPFIIDQLSLLPPDTKELDFLIVSLGGDPMVAWRIMSLIRQRGIETVSVLIPQSAYSAATLLALGADSIVLHPNGHLGPVDMQITTFSEGRRRQFSTEDISAFLAFVRESLGISDQEHIRRLFEVTCNEVSSLGIGFTARSSKLAVALGEKLLAMHIKGDEKTAQRRAIIENLSRQFHSHAYPVNRDEAVEIGLAIAEPDKTLEDLMWQLWLDLEAELREREPYHPIYVLLNSPEAPKLLSSVPQLELPANSPTPNYVQANLTEVQSAANVKIDGVDFEQVFALIESARRADRNIAKGKILAARQPDLTIQFNALTSFRGWTGP